MGQMKYGWIQPVMQNIQEISTNRQLFMGLHILGKLTQNYYHFSLHAIVMTN